MILFMAGRCNFGKEEGIDDGNPVEQPVFTAEMAGTWYWMVKAIGSFGNATESEVRSFIIE